ncbi:MAG: prohibitin family protein [Eubacteriales bacterium]|nr:prohibitin family protein [Eubacteriales bacterium]
MSKKWIKALVITVVCIIILLVVNPFVVIPAGHTGVRLTFGSVSDTTLQEGLHLKIPLVQVIKLIDNRIQIMQAECASASKDLQNISSVIAVNYRISTKSSAGIYKNVGMEYANIIIAPAIQEVVKATTAKFTAEELITRRQDASEDMKDILIAKTQTYGIVIENFNIINFDFSTEFNAAIEAKQTAQQMALKAEQDLIRIQIEAEQKVAQAKAEAEALKVQKQEITDELLRLRQIEASLKAIEKWDGVMPKFITSGSGTIFNIPVE